MTKRGMFKRWLVAVVIGIATCAAEAQTPRLVLPIGHTGTVKTAKFSPNDQTVVTASDDGTAKLWDVMTGDLLATLSGHTGEVTSVNFSRDGTKILTTSWDHTAKVWDAKTALLMQTLTGHDGIVHDGEFSADGKTVFTFSADRILTHTVTGPNPIDTFKAKSSFLRAGMFSPDQKFFITIPWTDGVRLWHAAGDQISDLGSKGKILEVAAFSKDSHLLVLGFKDNSIEVWNVQTQSRIFKIQGHQKQRLNDIAFSPDGQRIVASSEDDWFYLYDAHTGKLGGLNPCPTDDERYPPYGYKGIMKSVFTADGKKLITVSAKGASLTWDAHTLKLIGMLYFGGTLTSAELSHDGTKLVCASGSRAVVFSVSNGNVYSLLEGKNKPISECVLNHSGDQVLVTQWDAPVLWDVATGSIRKFLKGHDKLVSHAVFSPDDSKIASFDAELGGKIWNAKSGQFICDLDVDTSSSIVFKAKFDKEGKYLIGYGTYGTRITLWDGATGSLLGLLGRANAEANITSANFNPGGTDLVVTTSDSLMYIVGLSPVKIESVFHLKSGHSGNAEFSPDGKLVLFTGEACSEIWDIEKKKMIDSLPGRIYAFPSRFSPDSQKLLVNWGGPEIYDITSRKLTHDLNSGAKEADLARFSPDGLQAITCGTDRSVTVWNVASGDKVTGFQIQEDEHIADINFVSKTVLVTDMFKSKFGIYDLYTGKRKFEAASILEGDFIQTSSGYFKAAPEVARSLYYTTPALKPITFEQLDLRYNRPDKVLREIGCPDTVLINAYYQAYKKRLEKLHLNLTVFDNDIDVPQADFVHRELIPHASVNGELTVTIAASDLVHPLDRFNIWINKVPVYGMNGISVSAGHSKKLILTKTVKLSYGVNKIETSVINSNGMESYHLPLIVEYKPKQPKPSKFYFIGIGVNQYQNSIYNLRWSARDIRSLAAKFKEKLGKDCIIVDTLIDRNITAAKLAALKSRLSLTNVDDVVVIAYSGHGLFSSSYDYFLSTPNIDFDHPERKGIPYEAIENLLDGIPARDKLVLLNACNSGEIDKAAARGDISKDKRDLPEMIAAAQGLSDDLQHNAGVTNQRFFGLMQQLFANVDKNTGATVIASSAGTQYSYFDDSLQGSVFMTSVIEYLGKENVTISGLEKYLIQRVSALTNGLETPITRSYGNY